MGAMAGAQALRGGVLDEFSNVAKFLSEELKGLTRYGFRTLPDILLSGSLFLTFMLGGSWPIGFFSLGLIFTGLVQGLVGNLIRQNKPGFAKPGGALGGADEPPHANAGHLAKPATFAGEQKRNRMQPVGDLCHREIVLARLRRTVKGRKTSQRRRCHPSEGTPCRHAATHHLPLRIRSLSGPG